MTAVEPGESTPAPSVENDEVSGRSLIGLCPYLAADGGAWRSDAPAREHRCGAVTPPAPLATEKQRRLCLTPAHVTCATYEAARAARWVAPDRASGLPRPVARTAPVVLDRGRFDLSVPAIRAIGVDRSIGQAVLVGLLGIALVVFVLLRLSSGGTPTAAVGPGTSSSPRPTAARTSPTPASASRGPIVSTEPSGSQTPTRSPGASATPSPRPTARPTTYTVRARDTLGGIANKFHTTVAILEKLNGIKDPTKLRTGQVLKLP